MMLNDYEGALQDLNKVDVLEPNDAFALKIRRVIKNMLNHYE
jgi:hypothetical protein